MCTPSPVQCGVVGLAHAARSDREGREEAQPDPCTHETSLGTSSAPVNRPLRTAVRLDGASTTLNWPDFDPIDTWQNPQGFGRVSPGRRWPRAGASSSESDDRSSLDRWIGRAESDELALRRLGAIWPNVSARDPLPGPARRRVPPVRSAAPAGRVAPHAGLSAPAAPCRAPRSVAERRLADAVGAGAVAGHDVRLADHVGAQDVAEQVQLRAAGGWVTGRDVVDGAVELGQVDGAIGEQGRVAEVAPVRPGSRPAHAPDRAVSHRPAAGRQPGGDAVARLGPTRLEDLGKQLGPPTASIASTIPVASAS